MVRITVGGMGFARTLFGQELALALPAGTTVGALVRRLAQDHPAFAALAYPEGRLTDAVQIVVNDRLLDLGGGRDRVLEDGDHVLVLPPFEGGALRRPSR